MPLFSRRNEQHPDTYFYHLPQEVRSRLMHTLQHCIEGDDALMAQVSFLDVMYEVQLMLERQYGGLRQSGFEAARVSKIPAIEHFFKCDPEEAMDFLQLCFETKWGCGKQRTVTAINQVLAESNIGYELTDYEETFTQGAEFMGEFRPNVQEIHVKKPTVVRKDEKTLHAETVKPCLAALASPEYETAGRELQNAFDEYRKGCYADAITDAGSAFESVLKIICTQKGWSYDPQRDTCSKLLDICRDNELFPGFYKPILEGTATIRNKLGDAHGKGPQSIYAVTKELADHMLYTVCNNINLLVALARAN